MKNIVLLLLLAFSAICYSQETYTMESGGKIFNSKNERLTSAQVEKAFKSNRKALSLYKDGREKKIMGNILLWGGIGTFVGKALYDMYYSPGIERTGTDYFGNPTYKTEEPSRTLYFIAAGMVAFSIPIKIGFQNKIRKSVEIMNKQNNPDRVSIESANILVNRNGVGFSITY